MSIGEIRTALNTEKDKKNTNRQNLAYDHKSSLFYARDVRMNESNANVMNASLNNLSNYVSTISNLANSYNYRNTCSSLKSVQSMASKGFRERIIAELERASLESYTELRNQFDSNLRQINSNIMSVRKIIKTHDDLDAEIKKLEAEIAALKAQDPPGDTSALEARIVSYKNQQASIRLTAHTYLNNTKILNTTNTELLERGLKRV